MTAVIWPDFNCDLFSMVFDCRFFCMDLSGVLWNDMNNLQKIYLPNDISRQYVFLNRIISSIWSRQSSTIILSERIWTILFYRLVSMTIYSAYDSILSVLNSLRISVFLYRKRSYWLLDIIWFMKYWLTINCKINIYILITVFSDQISIAFFCGFDMSSRKF